jgi:hypothetical protein
MKIFISYSHKDEVWKNRLVTHLAALEHKEILDAWDDRRIQPGEHWEPAIEKSINEAAAAIMLVSANYLSSDFIKKKEIPALLEQGSKKNIKIFPIIIKPCPWRGLDWLKKIQAWPTDGKPLSGLTEFEIDTYLAEFAIKLHESLNKPSKISNYQSNSNREPENPDQPQDNDDIAEEEYILPHRRIILGALMGMPIGFLFGLLFGRLLSPEIDHMTSIIVNCMASTFIGAVTWKNGEMYYYPLAGSSGGFGLWLIIDIGISGPEVGVAARAFVYGLAVGAVIGIIIKWTKDIVEKIRTKNSKNGSSADKN